MMLLAALGALFAFLSSIGVTIAAESGTKVVEGWRMYGFLVFAGLFVLLALRPRHYPGAWEPAIFHKAATSATAAAFVGGGAAGALEVAVADGVLAGHNPRCLPALQGIRGLGTTPRRPLTYPVRYWTV